MVVWLVVGLVLACMAVALIRSARPARPRPAGRGARSSGWWGVGGDGGFFGGGGDGGSSCGDGGGGGGGDGGGGDC
jgi:hypothetical protein